MTESELTKPHKLSLPRVQNTAEDCAKQLAELSGADHLFTQNSNQPGSADGVHFGTWGREK